MSDNGTSRTWGVYAWRCDACQHLACDHRLVKDGDLVAGPYQCQDCDCQIRQDAPMTPLSRYQYERHMQRLSSRLSSRVGDVLRRNGGRL